MSGSGSGLRRRPPTRGLLITSGRRPARSRSSCLSPPGYEMARLRGGAERLRAVPGRGQVRQVRLVAAGAGLGTWHHDSVGGRWSAYTLRAWVQPASTAIEAPTRTIVAGRDEPPAWDDA